MAGLEYGSAEGCSIFHIADLQPDAPLKLFWMGFLTNVLNPKIAVMYLSLLPQFIQLHHDSVLAQSLSLGSVQISISALVNAAIVFSAGSIAVFSKQKLMWMPRQKWFMASVLSMLVLHLLRDTHK